MAQVTKLRLSIEVVPLVFGESKLTTIELNLDGGLALVNGSTTIDFSPGGTTQYALDAVAKTFPNIFNLPVYAGVKITCSKDVEKPLRKLLTWRQEGADFTEELEKAVEQTEFALAYWTIEARGHDYEKLLLLVNGKQWLVVRGQLYEESRAPSEEELDDLEANDHMAAERAAKKAAKAAVAEKARAELELQEYFESLINTPEHGLPEAIRELSSELARVYFSGFERKLALGVLLEKSKYINTPEFWELADRLPSIPMASINHALDELASRLEILREHKNL